MAEDVGVSGNGESELISRLAGIVGGELASTLAAVVESSDDAIIGKTLDGVITSWSVGASAMYGYAPDEVIGHNISELIPADRAGELPSILGRLGRGERISHFATKRVRKDGTVMDVSVSISPIMGAGGTVVGAASVGRDISGHVRAEANRRIMEARLRQSERMETAGRLAGGIAHDFNNTLGVILGYAGLLGDEADGSPAVQADVRRIEAAVRRAAGLTRQLLIFSRLDAVRVEKVDLNDMIAGLRDRLAADLGEGIELRFAPQGALPPVRADRGHLEQVLLNLAANARDAMPAGGIISVSTRVTELDEEYCAGHAGASPGRHVELAVRDTGTGMSPGVASRVFEPFFTTKPLGRGIGLGMPVVYSVVTRSGGSLSVQSEPGRGTAVRAFFPLAGVATPAAARPANGERILVVDDDPEMLAIVSRVLRKDGYAVTGARNAEEALALASSPDFGAELLLMDSCWSQVSGLGLAGQLAEMRPGLRVLYMSGNVAGGLSLGRLAGGDAEFIEKPFTGQALLEMIRAVMAAPAAAL